MQTLLLIYGYLTAPDKTQAEAALHLINLIERFKPKKMGP
jgi:hypothetical protein